eukprot:m.144561 g.144561  ORF g.144561 m.144561 type:complete len:54 (+) comp10065_c0_seq1:392-553(+)
MASSACSFVFFSISCLHCEFLLCCAAPTVLETAVFVFAAFVIFCRQSLCEYTT